MASECRNVGFYSGTLSRPVGWHKMRPAPNAPPLGLPLVLRARLPGRPGTTKYIVRISEKSRMNADSLCAKLRAAGGACIVLRNPSR